MSGLGLGFYTIIFKNLLWEVKISNVIKKRLICFTKQLQVIYRKLRYRGYLNYSVSDQFLFHQKKTKSSIFTSGEARSENTTFVLMRDMKSILHSKSLIFYFFKAFKFFYFF